MARWRDSRRILPFVLILALTACAERSEEGEPSVAPEETRGGPPVEASAGDAGTTTLEEPGTVADPATGAPVVADPLSGDPDTAARVAEEHRSVCEAQRANNPGEDYRVECTRAVTGDDRREVYQCTCIWGG